MNVKHIITGISEETRRDADLVIIFDNKAIQILKGKGVKTDEVHEWTDDCVLNIKKDKMAFVDISLRKLQKLTRNYFKT